MKVEDKYEIGGKVFPVENYIKLQNGKYTAVRLGEGGGNIWLRHGQRWPASEDLQFMNCINALLDYALSLEEKLDESDSLARDL